VSKSLRLKSFQPEEEYVYLTYSLKNDKKEESKILLENLQSPSTQSSRLVMGKGREKRSER